MFKTPDCGCCALRDHVGERLRGAVIDMPREELEGLFGAKQGVPSAPHSWHSALVDGDVLEGHIYVGP